MFFREKAIFESVTLDHFSQSGKSSFSTTAKTWCLPRARRICAPAPHTPQVLRPFDSTGTIDRYAHPGNFGTNALHAIVREVVSKCFQDVTMEKELSESFVESVAKNNFEW